MNTTAADKVMTRSARAMNTDNVTTRSTATSVNTAAAYLGAARNTATSKVTRNSATSMNAEAARKGTTSSAATSAKKLVNRKVIRKISKSDTASMKIEAASEGTTSSAATSIVRKISRSDAASMKIEAARKGTPSSAATSTKLLANKKVAMKMKMCARKFELGQCSKSVFVCDICTDSTAVEESFSVKGCHHKYCKECVRMYITSKLCENIAQIRCPASDCKSELEPDHCRSILPQEMFIKWCEKLCEAAFQGFKKIYCPYKDCSGMLIDDDGTQTIKESECPHCRRLFCAQCMVPWHSDIECAQFQALHEHERQREDILLMNLAQTNLWKRCPVCKIYVERTSGCRYIKCRCGAAFCYGCGSTDIDLNSHYCSRCQA